MDHTCIWYSSYNFHQHATTVIYNLEGSSIPTHLVTRTISYRIETSWKFSCCGSGMLGTMMIVGDKAGIFVWSWRCWKVEGNFMGGLGWFCMVTFSVVFGMGWWLKQVAEMAEMHRDRECSTSHASGLMLRCGEGLVGDFVVFWGKITQGSWIWNRLTIVFLFLSRFLMIPSLFFTVLKVIWKTQCGRCSLISSWDFEILKHSRMEVESWLSTKMWSEA